jgi:tRNA pseudouridine38-40 synthase
MTTRTSGRRNIRLLLAYDGTGFGGWQRQKNARSVQEELERALAAMHGHAVPTAGAGRTDAGVHALGQVANFYTDIAAIAASRFEPALNRLLPPDIRVLRSTEADFDFHARFDARLRRYRYFARCGRTVDPFASRYAHRLVRRPDLSSLNAMCALFLGETDFTTFSSARDQSLSRRRFVSEASFRWEGEALVFEIAANAFLLRMVRSLVGSLFHYEAQAALAAAEEGATAHEGATARELAARLMSCALESRDRGLAGPTAPAKGLFLWNVEYYPEPTRPGRGDYWSVARSDSEFEEA